MNRNSLLQTGRSRPVLLSLSLLLLSWSPASGRQAAPLATLAAATSTASATLTGTVTSRDGQPVTDAVVEIPTLRRRIVVGADGRFELTALPAGELRVRVVSPRAGVQTATVDLRAGEATQLDLVLDLAVHREELVVTATGEARGLGELAQAADVLAGQELLGRLQLSLGDTLAAQPGVHSTSFGPGASRPVIRGLGGGRVRVLEGGVGSGDASDTSPDHAVSANPFDAERIEILRGPASLLYGSAAVGGVVNILDERIPDYLPEEAVTGSLTLLGGSAANERSGGFHLDGRLGGRWAWHLDGFRRDSDDVEIPGLADADSEEEEEPGHEEEEPTGILENSAVEAEGGTVGVSYVAEGGFFGVSYTTYDTLYGVPGHAHHHEEEEEEPHVSRWLAGEEDEEEEEEAVRIDLEQRRFDVRGEINRELGIFRGLKLRFGQTNYEHQELEGDEVGTLFTNDSWELRIEAPHRQLGPFQGSLGLQASRRDFEAIGEEAFVPPTETTGHAVFLFEEITRGALTWQLGLRYETQDVEAVGELAADRSHAGVSASLGAVWKLGETWSLAAALARGVKLPNAEELFANGPHVATRSFEIGDPTLDEETSLGLDLTVRHDGEPVDGAVTFFGTRYDGFIIDLPTGEVLDDLPVFRYAARDAEFRGVEGELHIELWHGEPHHLELELSGDYVRAEDRQTGDPLPRIPPLRYAVGLLYQGAAWSGRIEARRVEEQDRVAANETTTDGYTFVNAELGYRFFTGRMVHDLLLRGTNLGDEEARNHVSFLKDLAPLPGRDVSLLYQLSF
jgi:iron complex outermembrane receptor protein